MTNSINQAAEEWLGINTNEEDVKKLKAYLWNTYGGDSPGIIDKVFISGEAAGFLTVNETYFFREPAHFAFLSECLTSMTGHSPGFVRICCAAVATGCEAYSIAMLFENFNKYLEEPIGYHIDAFDINPKVIETAQKGIYGTRSMREDGNCFHYLAAPYLKKLPARGQGIYSETGYGLDTSLQKNISFFVHNLMNELPQKEYDFIFFRNAFIYFTPKSRERVLTNLAGALREGGILIMGVSETAGVQHPNLEPRNKNDVFYFSKPVRQN